MNWTVGNIVLGIVLGLLCLGAISTVGIMLWLTTQAPSSPQPVSQAATPSEPTPDQTRGKLAIVDKDVLERKGEETGKKGFDRGVEYEKGRETSPGLIAKPKSPVPSTPTPPPTWTVTVQGNGEWKHSGIRARWGKGYTVRSDCPIPSLEIGLRLGTTIYGPIRPGVDLVDPRGHQVFPTRDGELLFRTRDPGAHTLEVSEPALSAEEIRRTLDRHDYVSTVVKP